VRIELLLNIIRGRERERERERKREREERSLIIKRCKIVSSQALTSMYKILKTICTINLNSKYLL